MGNLETGTISAGDQLHAVQPRYHSGDTVDLEARSRVIWLERLAAARGDRNNG